MAATVKTYINTGAGPTAADAPNIRFKLADNNTQDSNNPCIQPPAGNNFSFWKTFHFHAETAPATSISNVKVYTDGALAWTSCTVHIGDQQTDTYIQATGGTTSGDEMIANHSQISSKTDIFTYTVSAPLSVTLSASWTDTTGRVTKYLVIQLQITNGADGGLQAAETLTWQYDEV